MNSNQQLLNDIVTRFISAGVSNFYLDSSPGKGYYIGDKFQTNYRIYSNNTKELARLSEYLALCEDAKAVNDEYRALQDKVKAILSPEDWNIIFDAERIRSEAVQRMKAQLTDDEWKLYKTNEYFEFS